ncbi:MAG: flavodoxin domain-containing protein, partial [Chloroflexi bacterium]|nr:flavodoxin domain-containing protein [Chloroflexota bacterium]
LQEATLVLGMLLQRLEFVDYAGYELKIKETMTVKPEDFLIQVRPRTRRNGAVHAPATPSVAVAVAPEEEADEEAEAQSPPVMVRHAAPLLVLFGSNLGSTEDLARQLANDATSRGFNTSVAPLDEYVNRLPTDGVVVIATASYNGNPPDNAARFVDWLSGDSLAADALRGVKYTVFGCGSREWASTYQKVPNTIDQALTAHGAERIYTHGEGDVSDDFDDQLRSWSGPLWPALAAAVGVSVEGTEEIDAGHRYEVEVVAEPTVASPFRTEYGARALRIHANRELHRTDGPNPSPRSTRHIEVALADGVEYLPGDYLGVLPHNSEELVRRVATRFKLEPSARLRIVNNSTSKSFLPVDQPIEVATLLGSYLDVQDVATRSQIQVLAEYAECPPERQRLLAVAGDDADSAARYRQEILERHISVLDLLEDNQSCSLPFNIYLEFLPPLKPRYYSISSSPLVDADQCSVTVGVLDAPARSGHGRYRGVCSTYLSLQGEGATIEGFIKNPSTQFRLPADPTTPLIMVGTGTGLAPYRGFLQERAELQKSGKTLGPALLFFGCRNPAQDYLYEDELRDFELAGVGSVVCAFSRLENQPRMYVQDAIKAQADDVWSLLESGGIIYVCGDASRMAPDVRKAFASLYQQRTGVDEASADAWVSELVTQQRYVADVWPSN